MQVNYVLDTEQLREDIAPYTEALTPQGIDSQRLIGYALKLLCSDDQDYATCQKAIHEDLANWQVAGTLFESPKVDMLFTPEKVDKLTHICMDAVGEVLNHLTPQVIELVGGLPPYLHLRGFAGEDPVIGVECPP